MATSQNQINLTIPSTQDPSETNDNHIEKIFPKYAIKLCSFLQLFCAFAAAFVQLQILMWTSRNFLDDAFYLTFFTIFFGAAGGVGLLAVHRPSYCTIIAFMVTSIIATFFAFIFMCISISQVERQQRKSNSIGIALVGTQVMLGLIEIVVAITTSAFSCRAVCCRKRHEPGMVFYNANVGNSAAGNEDLIVNLPPPDYEEIAGAQALPRNDGEKQPI